MAENASASRENLLVAEQKLRKARDSFHNPKQIEAIDNLLCQKLTLMTMTQSSLDKAILEILLQ